MGGFTGFLIERFRAWEPRARIGFIIALLLLVPTFIAAAYGPQEIAEPAMFGVIGLIISAQVIFMWANRGMVTPFTRAQRHYMREEFVAARDILEGLRAEDKANMQALTLLGNTYRQLGQISVSEAVLSEAVDKHPNHYFPLYGFGRTLLVSGRYAEAADAILRAIENGAGPVVGFDAGEARFRQGIVDEAVALLREAQPHVQVEAHRALMTAYLLHRLDDEPPPSVELIADGLAYWQKQASLFQQTPYGEAVERDIREMQRLSEEV